MIAIIDYGMGNLRSIQKALEHFGCHAEITQDPRIIAAAERVVLPGVGAFGAAMANLERLNLVEPVKNAALSGKPFLGICLGMQLLLSESEEMGLFKGLDLVPGRVIRFNINKNLKVPHMGWNALKVERPCKLMQGAGGWSASLFRSFLLSCAVHRVRSGNERLRHAVLRRNCKRQYLRNPVPPRKERERGTADAS